MTETWRSGAITRTDSEEVASLLDVSPRLHLSQTVFYCIAELMIIRLLWDKPGNVWTDGIGDLGVPVLLRWPMAGASGVFDLSSTYACLTDFQQCGASLTNCVVSSMSALICCVAVFNGDQIGGFHRPHDSKAFLLQGRMPQAQWS